MNVPESKIDRILTSYIPARLSPEGLVLPRGVRKALPSLVKAMDAVHEIFLEQQSEELAERIRKKSREGDLLGRFYRRFKGPWYPVEDFRSYDPEVPDRDPRCSFYPSDMSAEEFRGLVSRMPQEERERWESPTTLIRRGGEGELTAVPYHSAYADRLGEVFDGLEEAADILEDEQEEGGEDALADYLRTRAEALVSGSYREADSEWVELTGVPLEVVVGPYEVYSDALLGRKAMYEGMLLVVDEERCSRLKEVEENVERLAEGFPLPAGSKPAVGGIAPMIVAHEIYGAGEAAQPIYPAAFNLPNDPRVRGNVGWKQVMLYNVMQAKFEHATSAIAHRILADPEGGSFEPYFYHVLLHEVSHGLGPAYRADGRSVDNCLGPHYTILEEAKADTGGLSLLLRHGGSAGIPEFAEEEVLKGYTSALFRSMRFGLKEAHGAANVIEHNWMLERGVLERGRDGYIVHPEKAGEAVDTLLEELCRLQAEASVEEAGEFISRWATPDRELQRAIGKLSDLPVDLFFEFDPLLSGEVADK
jgi:hypothetical protein